jgi:hypothetical protein
VDTSLYAQIGFWGSIASVVGLVISSVQLFRTNKRVSLLMAHPLPRFARPLVQGS